MLSRAQAARVRALHRRKGREEAGEFLVEGIRQVEDLIASPVVPRLALVSPSLEDTPRGTELSARLRAIATTVGVTDPELGQLATTETTQGVLVVASIPRIALGDVTLDQRALLIVLDGVQDPGNLGTLVRTADAFGVRGVIALPGTVDAWNSKVVRSAAGSLFRTPVVHTGVDAAGRWLRSERYRVYAAESGGTPVDSMVPAARRALVVGNEGAGLSADARALADEHVAIPMPGHAESLNVAIAAGILLYVLTRENA